MKGQNLPKLTDEQAAAFLLLDSDLHDARAKAHLLMNTCMGAEHITKGSTFLDSPLMFRALTDLSHDLYKYLTALRDAVGEGLVTVPREPPK